jgi:hypothetical protein
MNEFDFQSNWMPIIDLPPSATRCIVTDGNIVAFATYIKDNEHEVWLFEGLQEKDPKLDIIGWMPSPKPMKRKEVKTAYVEKNTGKD